MRHFRPQLLVSIQSVAEVETAITGGADWLDIKNPDRGSLGRADHSVILQIIQRVEGQIPISLALGEWIDWVPESFDSNLFCQGPRFVKWGLSQIDFSKDWQPVLRRTYQQLPDSIRPVLVAYADYQRAKTHSPIEWVTLAPKLGVSTLLLDTFGKDGSTLLDWISLSQLQELSIQSKQEGLMVAFAGSLREEQIPSLVVLQPDWIAVRGAACRDGIRTNPIDPDRVSRLKKLLS